ncbi:unnamed protein product, partial [Protopolystoma xenopodis]
MAGDRRLERKVGEIESDGSGTFKEPFICEFGGQSYSSSDTVSCHGDGPHASTTKTNCAYGITYAASLGVKSGEAECESASCASAKVASVGQGLDEAGKEVVTSQSGRERLLEWLRESQAKRDENNRQVFTRWIDRYEAATRMAAEQAAAAAALAAATSASSLQAPPPTTQLSSSLGLPQQQLSQSGAPSLSHHHLSSAGMPPLFLTSQTQPTVTSLAQPALIQASQASPAVMLSGPPPGGPGLLPQAFTLENALGSMNLNAQLSSPIETCQQASLSSAYLMNRGPLLCPDIVAPSFYALHDLPHPCSPSTNSTASTSSISSVASSVASVPSVSTSLAVIKSTPSSPTPSGQILSNLDVQDGLNKELVKPDASSELYHKHKHKEPTGKNIPCNMCDDEYKEPTYSPRENELACPNCEKTCELQTVLERQTESKSPSLARSMSDHKGRPVKPDLTEVKDKPNFSQHRQQHQHQPLQQQVGLHHLPSAGQRYSYLYNYALYMPSLAETSYCYLPYQPAWSPQQGFQPSFAYRSQQPMVAACSSIPTDQSPIGLPYPPSYAPGPIHLHQPPIEPHQSVYPTGQHLRSPHCHSSEQSPNPNQPSHHLQAQQQQQQTYQHMLQQQQHLQKSLPPSIPMLAQQAHVHQPTLCHQPNQQTVYPA